LPSVRTSAKAIIIRDGQILLTENRDDRGLWYLPPGGGQEPGETLHAALLRECREEIGAVVEIGELCFIREYIGGSHEFAYKDADVHQVEFFFACAIAADYEPSIGTVPDSMQIGAKWIPLAELGEHRFYPSTLRTHLESHASLAAQPIYLGDVN